LYATCTVRRAENEEVAKAFRATHPEFVLETPKVQGLDESLVSGDCFRCSPHRHGTDGFFAALFRRRSAARAEP
ncbi:MAG TPA: RsmB/NOP family class I SAM-dependent RNA methyltransferase, partial [Myxococcaceae bacterium]|nr:RsmB/NOP family class I SAM-dependent RNA methyltransferase [Myxococcaceae bacterium]